MTTESHGFVVPEGAKFTERAHLDGVQVKFTMPNGYGASVIRHAYSYGGPEGFWELAVLDVDGSLDYSTPITSDVIGWLEPDAVSGLLADVAAWPASPSREEQ